jgi:1,4-dihydroxy-2-naphthoyl-CoA hydrolase
MAIWHSGFPLDDANRRGRGCAVGHLGIELVEAGDDWLKARMPVDDRTRQPAGVLWLRPGARWFPAARPPERCRPP